MKKILLAIFGAALLMVGCTKEIETSVNDINSRLTTLEAQVAANKTAIEELKKADFVSAVEEVPGTGWNITLSNGQILHLYNGAAGAQGPQGPQGPEGAKGADGDAFFANVALSEDGESVVITLAGESGATFVLPLVVEFELQIVAEDAALKAGQTIAVPYRIKGATDATKLHVTMCYPYAAEISANSPEILITAPDVLVPGHVVVMADRGDGRVSTKTINFVGQELNVTTDFARAAYFWGDSFKEKVVSNVPVTFSSDVPWLTFEGTKATEEYEVTVKVAVTPTCLSRTGHVIVKDMDGNIVQNLAVEQGGCSPFFINNHKSFTTWAAAAEALATAEPSDDAQEGLIWTADGKVEVIISEGANLDRIVLPANEAIKKLVIKPRFYGVPAADPTKVVVKGVTVPAGIPTTIENIVIRPTAAGSAVDGVNYGNAIGLYLGSGTQTLSVKNVIFDGLEETYSAGTPTMIFAQSPDSLSVLNFEGCTINTIKGGNGDGIEGGRMAQLYGRGTYTFDGCVFNGGYYEYNFRVYDGVNLVLKNNVINVYNNWVAFRDKGKSNQFDWTKGSVIPAIETDSSWKLTSEDSNIYGPDVVRVYSGYTNKGEGDKVNQSIYPASKGGSGIVTLGAIKYPTLSAAIAAAASGSVIEVGEGSIDDQVKIPNNMTLTIKGAGRGKTIINGNLEIAGSLLIQDLTLKTKVGLTTKDLGVKVSGDNYEWGHIYLARVENGAHDVTFDNVQFDATLENADFAGTMSMLWISQATNVTVQNCVFDAVAGGAYCPNQTHMADVLWKNNVFNGLGKKAWAIRVMDQTYATITGNEFNIAGEAIELYSDFLNYKGSLIMGDGVDDDNYYSAGVTHAIYSVYPLADYLFEGVTIKPTSLMFNAPTTKGKNDPILSLVWAHMDDAAWAETVPTLANVRNMAMNANGLYLASTDGRIYTLALADGAVAKDQAMTLTDGLFKIDGMASLDDGTIIMSDMVNAAGQNFKLFTYDGDKLDTLAKWTSSAIDGVAPRIGDMISASGTKDDIRVVTLDYAPGSARTFFWTLAPGQVKDKYVSMIYHGNGGFNTAGTKPGIGTQTLYKDNTYYVAFDGATFADAIVTANPSTWGGQFVANANLTDLGVKETRGTSFFVADGKEYMAVMEMRNYNGSNSYGAIVRVYPLPTGDLVADLANATAVASYEFPSSTANGNACGSLDVITVDGKVYIGIGVRSTGAALLEFKF